MIKNKLKIGVLTGGGDCPGLNAVIRAVTKSAIIDHGAEVIGFENGFEGLINKKFRKLDYAAASGILQLGGTILGTSNKANPFAVPVKKGKTVKIEDKSGEVVSCCKKLKLDCLAVIGGDGSMSIANKLAFKGLNVVGIPKTIDNDLTGTDVTFGFDSAASVATDAIDRLHTTAMSHNRVMVVEIMGRYAGWLALSSGLAGGGDIILIPEIPYKLEEICRVIEKRRSSGKHFTIVVVSEGAKPFGGEMVVKQIVKDSPDPVRLGGIANKLADDIENATGFESRATVLGHLQRGGSPSAYDRVLASRYGVKAVELIVRGDFGKMAALRGNEIVAVDISYAVSKLKLVKPDCELVKVAKSVGTSFGA